MDFTHGNDKKAVTQCGGTPERKNRKVPNVVKGGDCGVQTVQIKGILRKKCKEKMTNPEKWTDLRFLPSCGLRASTLGQELWGGGEAIMSH